MRRSALLLLATTQLLAGCAMTFDASKVGVPVTMASSAEAPAQGERFKVPFLGRLPLYQPIREGGDSGVPLVVSEPGSPAGRAFLALAQRMGTQIAVSAHRSAEANKGRIPLIPVR